MKKYIILSLLLLILTNAIGQGNANNNIRPEIKAIADAIAEDNVLKSAGVGITGTRTQQWDRYESLRSKSSIKELIALCENNNAVVRCYAFQALIERRYKNFLPILIKHLSDTTSVMTFSGCEMDKEFAGDCFFNQVNPAYHKTDPKLDAKGLLMVDSILLFDKNVRLYAKSRLLQDMSPNKKYYNRVREIFLIEKDKTAILTLSKFKNPRDIPLILSLLNSKDQDDQYYGLWAVRNFPDKSFFVVVTSIHAREIEKITGFHYPLLRMLYQAIVQYKNEASRKLLEQSLTGIKTSSTLQYHSENIWIALKKYDSPIYKGIIEKIKLSESETRELMYEVKSDS
jgi:hypothetical protein